MTGSAWRRSREALGYVSELHGRLGSRLVLLVSAGVIAGAAEAVSLLALVRAAFGISNDSAQVALLPGVPGRLSPGTALLTALVCAVLAAVLHLALSRQNVRLGERVALAGRTRLIDAFMAAQWAHVARAPAASFQQAITSLADKAGRAGVHLASALSATVIAGSLAVVAVWIGGWVALVLSALPLLGALLLRRYLRDTFERSSASIANALNLTQLAAETTSLGLEYRAAGVEREQSERLHTAAAAHAGRLARVRTRSLAVNVISRDVVMIALISIVALLYLVVELDAAVAAAVLIVVRMFGYVQQAIRGSHDGMEELAAALALRELIAELEGQRRPDGSIPISEITRLEFCDVSYSYNGRHRALAGLTLSLPVNTTIGVVGPSGAGKSTFAEVLLGLRRPDEGRVLVNGLDLADLDRTDWSRLVAFVPQHQQFAAMSVGDNIRFLRPWITDADVVDAARRAHVLDEIEQLPGGFEHVLTSRTLGTSGGQRQRIAIARALAGRPSLLVLDEPTSALDSVTEQRFSQTLEELHGSMTIVLIAHRPTTLACCDQIVRLANGRVELAGRVG